jgi:hypothetical protein
MLEIRQNDKYVAFTIIRVYLRRLSYTISILATRARYFAPEHILKERNAVGRRGTHHQSRTAAPARPDVAAPSCCRCRYTASSGAWRGPSCLLGNRTKVPWLAQGDGKGREKSEWVKSVGGCEQRYSLLGVECSLNGRAVARCCTSC